MLVWNFLKSINYKSILIELIILLALIFVIAYFALAINIFPPFAFLALIPIVIVTFYFLPKTNSFPETLLLRLILIWLPLTVLWPFFVVVQAPGIDIHPSRLILLALVLLWIYYIFKSDLFRSRLTEYNQLYRFFFLFIMLLLLTKFSGVLVSSYPIAAFNGFFKELTEVFIPAFLFLALVKKREILDKVISILTWVGVIVVLIGLWEYQIQTTVFQAYLPSFLTGSKEHILESIAPKIRDGEYRLQSLFGHPLSYAQYLALIFPFFIYQFFKRKQKLYKAFWLLISLALIFVMFGTGSRSVMPALIVELGVLLVMMIFIFLKNNKSSFLGWLYIVLSPVVLIGGALMVLVGRQTFMGGSDLAYSSTQARFEMWDLGLERIASSPFQGLIGFGHSTATEVINWHGGASIDTYFLSVLIETGIIGFVMFVFMILFTIYVGFMNWMTSQQKDHLQIALIASILGYSVIALISSLTHILHIFYIMIALVFASKWLTQKENSRD